MSTSDERREIARRLRAAAKTKSNSVDYLWKRLEIAVNGWKFGDVIDESYVFDNDVLSRLADLIDPTCHVVTTASGAAGPSAVRAPCATRSSTLRRHGHMACGTARSAGTGWWTMMTEVIA